VIEYLLIEGRRVKNHLPGEPPKATLVAERPLVHLRPVPPTDPLLLRRRPLTASVARRRRLPLLMAPWTMSGLVTLFILLQYLIPARLVIGGLGGAGRPSMVVGLGLFLCWMSSWLYLNGQQSGRQPVRWLVWGFLLAALLAYGAGYLRGLPEIESGASDRYMILIFALSGVALSIADGVADRATFDVLVRRLVGMTAIVAGIGIFEGLTGSDPISTISIPGLRSTGDALEPSLRGDQGFARVASTAAHYIEFSVVVAAAVPLAMHYALFARTRTERRYRWALVACLAAAIPFAIARSGILTLGVGVIVLAAVWTWRRRLIAVAVGTLGAVAFSVVKPGLLGTIRSLFTGASDDPSVQHRLADYDQAYIFIGQRPLLGRGPGSFVPSQYFFLDNEFLYTMITGGLVGLLALVALVTGAIILTRSVRLRGADAETRHLGQALAASLISALIAAGTFDALSFTTYAGLLFLLVGLAGALWRIDGGRCQRPVVIIPPGETPTTPWVQRRQPLGARPLAASVPIKPEGRDVRT
jgi:O-antigen ligase/polysaccharide polymerase Wzy-like membrane protein